MGNGAPVVNQAAANYAAPSTSPSPATTVSSAYSDAGVDESNYDDIPF
jgi:hypothetical protein